MFDLREDTAGQTVPLGPFVDSTDGVTAETALTINASDIKLTKHGATATANKNSGGATHYNGGVYYATFDATDCSTAGRLRVDVQVAGAAPVWHEWIVLPQDVYDAKYAGDYVTAADIGAAVWDAAGADHNTASTFGRFMNVLSRIFGNS